MEEYIFNEIDQVANIGLGEEKTDTFTMQRGVPDRSAWRPQKPSKNRRRKAAIY